MTPAQARAFQEAVLETIGEETSESGRPLDVRYFFLPSEHRKGLGWETGLVEGIRGSGKSTLFSALLSDEHHLLPDLPGFHSVAGFGEVASDNYPDRATLGLLLQSGFDPRDIWRTVVAFNSWRPTENSLLGLPTWRERVAFLSGDPEASALRFRALNEELSREGQRRMLLFDSLDRAAEGWTDIARLLRGILETVLELRPFSHLHAKAFVRPDMLELPAVKSFPDASKVMANRVRLLWTRSELYSLLWQRVGNSYRQGKWFRAYASPSDPWEEAARAYQVPRALRQEARQAELMEDVVGSSMGTDRRRGVPYSWLPNHLSDALDQVSPRSFLQAVRVAASQTHELYPDAPRAIHYECLKLGVSRASHIRVAELEEDFPWVVPVMRALEGLVVPCYTEEILQAWSERRLLSRLKTETLAARLPRRIEQGLPGLLEDLLELGLLKRMVDDRVNMPDVYRIGFGLKRKGGVKPVR